jgi:hypothetical protein
MIGGGNIKKEKQKVWLMEERLAGCASYLDYPVLATCSDLVNKKIT